MFQPIVLRRAVWCFVFLGFVSGNARSAEDGNEAQPQEKPGWEEKTRQALDKPVTLEVVETGLGTVADHLRQQAGVPNLFLDERALDDVGIGSDVPITWKLRELPLRSVLNLILRELDLTYVIRDGGLIITTPEEAETHLITQVIDVLDLVRPHDQAGPEEYDYDSLIELITSIVAPTTWVDAGGAGAIDGFRGTLIFSQTQGVLDEIRDLLDTLREARKVYVEHGKKTPPVTWLPVGNEPYKEINAALPRRQNFEFTETPLDDVAAKLSKAQGVPILLDYRSLEDVGIDGDSPVTFAATNLSLRHALRHMLHPLDLTFVLRDRVLLITTPEEAEACPITRVYPVADLVLGSDSLPAWFSNPFGGGDFDSIIEVITSNVAPTTWVDVGGFGGIEAATKSMSLVISQTRDVHDQVEQLLARIRKTVQTQEFAEAKPDEGDKDGLVLKVYFVVSKSSVPETPKVPEQQQNNAGNQVGQRPQTQILAQAVGGHPGFFFDMGLHSALFEEDDLLEIIQELVEPDSWDEEGVYARPAPGRLIIRQSPEVHRKIGQLLTRLGVIYQDSSKRPTGGFGGGGMGGFFGGGMGMGGGMGGGGGFF
jgi:hypothetical protein